MPVYPLRFAPIFMPRIWGGRRLAEGLGKPLPPGQAIGESWELVDLDQHQSLVTWGPAKGRTLGALVREWGADLTGRAPLVDGGFPLLIKFLDAREPLSLQVHPVEDAVGRDPHGEAAARRNSRTSGDSRTSESTGGQAASGTHSPARVKHEAWYVIDAETGAVIYRGLRQGVQPEDLREVSRDRIDELVERIPAKKGHAYYLPSGTVHALGGGVLVAEVQTPSDTTYRIYDWDRLDAGGKPRELHIDQAIPHIATEPVPREAEKPQHVASLWTSITSLVRCESFVIERVRMVAGVEQPIPYEEMMIWIVLEGAGRVWSKGLAEPLRFGIGDTILLPAALQDGRVQADENSMWLEVSVPVPSSLSGFERPPPDAFSRGLDLVPLNLPNRGQDEKSERR